MNLASAVHAEAAMIASQLLRLGQTAEGNFLELVGAPRDFKDRSSGPGSEHLDTQIYSK